MITSAGSPSRACVPTSTPLASSSLAARGSTASATSRRSMASALALLRSSPGTTECPGGRHQVHSGAAAPRDLRPPAHCCLDAGGTIRSYDNRAQGLSVESVLVLGVGRSLRDRARSRCALVAFDGLPDAALERRAQRLQVRSAHGALVRVVGEPLPAYRTAFGLIFDGRLTPEQSHASPFIGQAPELCGGPGDGPCIKDTIPGVVVIKLCARSMSAIPRRAGFERWRVHCQLRPTASPAQA